MTHQLTFSIWIASKTRWAHLTKTINMQAVPRVGEFVKLTLEGEDDCVPWKISEITYRESERIEIWTDLLDDVDGRGYSFDNEKEFDDTLAQYQASGWNCPRGVKPNTRVERQTNQAEQEGADRPPTGAQLKAAGKSDRFQ